MPNITGSNVSDLLATADWFSELSRNASRVARAYRAADRKANKAQKAIQEAFNASRKANILGEKILGGQVTANGSDVPQDVPMVVTDRTAHDEMWARWFAEQQAEMDADAFESSNDSEE